MLGKLHSILSHIELVVICSSLDVRLLLLVLNASGAGKEQWVGLVAFIDIVLFQFHLTSSSERYFPTPVAWG